MPVKPLNPARAVVRLITVRVSRRAAARGRAFSAPLRGRSALGLLAYIELLNAAISLDSVATAFSLTLNVALICLGLLVGATYVRSMTVYAVRRSMRAGATQEYLYLEHGKYFAIGMVSTFMLVSLWRSVPGDEVRVAALPFIILAFLSSVAVKRRQQGPLRSRIATFDSGSRIV